MKQTKPRTVLVILIVVLLVGTYLAKQFRRDLPAQDMEFNRSAVGLTYTRHAQCRMACRDIDTTDILQILKSGSVDWSKSDMNDKPCPSYALEGACRHGDQLRVIFAQCKTNTRVVTCFPLNRHPECHCPGDKTDRP